ncbi:FMN-binding protein [Paenibacillus sp. 19GGS1-52]|uniref:FMN-binding protein n=1 Tax=Paenibacillus sp. 19GGS1-52 TaxID=2758563 RepID=UPI001EFB6B70|nr:FMN-binding protein [Paenibacillus sp. 19GGS1-52]ULO07373.1 FMN-binding protein [Paenibacillus sp. 19GGS1-52]
MAKTNKKWVLLCSTAVTAVYVAGYFATDTQASIVQPTPTAYTQVSTQTKVTTVNSSPTPTTTPTKAVVNSLYKDGTYTGTGNNRRGTIQVAVTIKNDKITDVEISDYAMRYSQRYVSGLPGEVLQTQSAQVVNVSGATYSTQAFKASVLDALSQAQNA